MFVPIFNYDNEYDCKDKGQTLKNLKETIKDIDYMSNVIFNLNGSSPSMSARSIFSKMGINRLGD